MQPPPTQYVKRDGISIAYQVVGSGPVDLLISPGFISHLDLQWTDPNLTRWLARLASFARLILYDKPGTGLSDPIPQLPTLEERCADIEAVMDAAGSERAVLLGISEGGPTSLLLAATRPHRVRSLVLYGTFAVMPVSAPEAYPPELRPRAGAYMKRVEEMLEQWGGGAGMAMFAPSAPERQRRFFATYARAGASPAMARALIETVMKIDVRDILASVPVPTLVLHVEGDRVVPVDAARVLAAGIRGARLVEFPGIDHAFWFGDWEMIAAEIERFLTGSVHRHEEANRVLTTVLFTDIVDSTRRAAELGDGAWRELLERHDAAVQRVASEGGGRVVKHVGDGALAAFDGPARALRAAEELRHAVAELGIELRAGVHTGECEAIGEDLGGLAVHIGARVAALAAPGEIAVSSTVKELVVGSSMRFADRGEHELKGVPERWRIYVLGAERARLAKLDGPAAHMRRSDRLTVALARRAPRAMRFGARFATRGAAPT